MVIQKKTIEVSNISDGQLIAFTNIVGDSALATYSILGADEEEVSFQFFETNDFLSFNSCSDIFDPQETPYRMEFRHEKIHLLIKVIAKGDTTTGTVFFNLASK